METLGQTTKSRKDILIRFLFTVFFLIVFEICKTILQVVVLFQYIFLFITKTHSDPVRRFGGNLASYVEKVMRYLTLNDNQKPFPFDEFPKEKPTPPEPPKFE